MGYESEAEKNFLNILAKQGKNREELEENFKKAREEYQDTYGEVFDGCMYGDGDNDHFIVKVLKAKGIYE